MKQAKYTCDRCRTEEITDKRLERPGGWMVVETTGTISYYDLCPDCYRAYLDIAERMRGADTAASEKKALIFRAFMENKI